MFVSLYDFFKSRRLLLLAVFSLTAGCFLWASLNIRLKQDIADMLPDSRALRAMNDVIGNTAAGEAMIVVLSRRNGDKTLTTEEQDTLTLSADDYIASLQKSFPGEIDTVTTGVGNLEETLPSIVEQYYPLLLDSSDYAALPSRMSADKIRTNLKSAKGILLSPASAVYKNIVAADPAGLSAAVWKKLAALQVDTSYSVYNGYLLSAGEGTLTFFFKTKNPASATAENARFFNSLDGWNKAWEGRHPGISAQYFGGAAVAAGNAAQLQTDTILTLSVTAILLLLLTLYYFRRKRTPMLLIVPVLYGALAGGAALYFFQGSVSVIALAAGAIVLGIAMDYAIHFLSTVREDHGDIRETIRHLQVPLTLGSITTIAAFFALRLVETQILRDLGLFAGASLIGAALCTLIFLPHAPLGKTAALVRKDTIFDRLGRWQPQRSKLLLIAIVVLTPVMLWFCRSVQFDSDLMHLNYMSPALQTAEAKVSASASAALRSVFVIGEGSSQEEAIGNLQRASTVLQDLSRRGQIRSMSNPVQLLPSKAELNRRLAAWRAFFTKARITGAAADIDAAARAEGFSPTAFSGFHAMMAAPPADIDSGSRAILRGLFPSGLAAHGSRHFAIATLKIAGDARDDVFKALQNVPEILVTDRQQGVSQLADVLRNDFGKIALYTSLIVFLALLIGYGRIELALISFLPMLVSWIWLLGAMVLLGLKFNIVNIILSTLVFGLGDDYTIFTMDSLVDKYKRGKGSLDTVRTSIYVSVTTVLIGLGVLLLAKHPALRSIAGISITGMLCVVIISQTLQPALFNALIQKRADKGFQPFTLWSLLKSAFAFLYFFTGSLVLSIAGFLLVRIGPFGKERGRYLLHALLRGYTWSMLHIMGNVRKRYFNTQDADFSKPAVYIANHSSFLDILVVASMHPRVVLLTNKWVWRSPVFGSVVRMAEYYPVADGAEESLGPLQSLVSRGYSIVVFPEGTRSYTDKIARFKKGAFYIAEKLGLDIVPVILHGVHYTMQKGDWLLKDGIISVHYQPAIPPGETSYGATYSERAKKVAAAFRTAHERIKAADETPSYFREQLIRSYTYKGPVLEWYCRIKTRLERNYEAFHRLLPREGDIYDLGCGYGFAAYMLHWSATDRKMTGIDYDACKIEVAQALHLRDEKIQFRQSDLTAFVPGPCDGVLLLDVLHYMKPDDQDALLTRCAAALRPGGVLIIRDGITELQKKHRGTRMSEFFSVKLFRFNKATEKLHFTSRAAIRLFAETYSLSIEEVNNPKLTSNVVFVLRKSANAGSDSIRTGI